MIFDEVFDISSLNLQDAHYIFSQRVFEEKISPATPATYEMIPFVFFLQVRPEKALRCYIINVAQYILEINITETSQ